MRTSAVNTVAHNLLRYRANSGSADSPESKLPEMVKAAELRTLRPLSQLPSRGSHLVSTRILFPFVQKVKRDGSLLESAVPAFKYPQVFIKKTGPAFDHLHGPGARVPLSGIYRCTGCGDEIASNKGTVFPPQNHRQHRLGTGLIRWQLVAAAIQL